MINMIYKCWLFHILQRMQFQHSLWIKKRNTVVVGVKSQLIILTNACYYGFYHGYYHSYYRYPNHYHSCAIVSTHE